MKKLLVYALVIFTTSALACTDFRLQAQDGSYLITRSMEFAADMQSNLIAVPRQVSFSGMAPNSKIGFNWKNQYGYVMVDAFNTGYAIDGMNEKGLTIEALYLPGNTQYPSVPAGKEASGLFYLQFGNWILGNFTTVEEVKKALPGIVVYGAPLPAFNNMVFPLHFNICDSTGNSIVIEFVNGNMRVYPNVLGILTNSPTYDWHLTNLRNYINMTPLTPLPVKVDGLSFVATGQGAGMFGLPGDVSPPSRFVKATLMVKTVLPGRDAEATLNIAQHIINNFDIPLGFVRESQHIDNTTNELTQWVVFKDLTHKVLYYRTYADLSLHVVDLNKLDFSPTAKSLKIPLVSKQILVNMTSKLQQAT